MDTQLPQERMTPQEFAAAMALIFQKDKWGHSDPSNTHPKADELMSNLLMALGYTEGVEIYNSEELWYE
jgi:hypothetical protein